MNGQEEQWINCRSSVYIGVGCWRVWISPVKYQVLRLDVVRGKIDYSNCVLLRYFIFPRASRLCLHVYRISILKLAIAM